MSKEVKKLECEEAIRKLLEYLDHELAHTDHEAMQNHLHTCRSCYTRMEFEKRLKQMVKGDDKAVASNSLKDRIRNIAKNFK